MPTSALLDDWLRAHGAASADDAERADLDRMHALVQNAGDDAFSRRHFAPGHFTCSAFVVRGAELLLIHHTKLQRWLQPGGHVELDDDTLLEGARREAHEETHVPLLQLRHVAGAHGPIFDVDIHTIPARKDEPAHDHFDVRFLFVVDDDVEVAAGDGVSDVQWMPFDDVTEAATDASVMRAVHKLKQQAIAASG